jgi:hypothetical protein
MLILLTMSALANPAPDGSEVSPPQPVAIDVDALFSGEPGEGQRRCRSEKPDVVFVSQSYTGGPPPPPGMVTSSTLLIIDGVVVEARQVRAEEPAPPPIVTVEAQSGPSPMPVGEFGAVSRAPASVVLSRVDGAPIRGDEKRLAVTWTCEWKLHPPRP